MNYSIQALVDRELSRAHEKEVLALVQSDPALGSRLRQLLKQKNMIKIWWRSGCDEA